MEQTKNVLKSIYNTLKANNAFQQAKSFDEFAAKMKYPGYNNQMYNYFTKNGGKTTISRWRAATGYTAPAKPHSRLVEQAMNFGRGVKVNDSDVRAPFKPENNYVSAKPNEDRFEPVRDAVEVDPYGNKVHVAKPIAEDYKKVTNGKFTPAKQQVVDKKGKVVAEHDIYPIQPAEVELDQQLKAYDKQMKAADAQEKKQLAVARKRAENDYNTAVSKEMNKKRSFWQMLGDEMVSANMAQHGINYDPQFERGKNSEAARNAQARLDMIDSAQKIINEVRSEKTDKDGFIGFVQGSGRGFRDSALSSKTWSFGARDANESLQLLGAIMANDNGVATKEQKELLNVAAMKTGIEGKYSNLLGRGYKAGQVTGESLPFMVEIMMNPASGLGKGAQQGLGKYLIKKYGKNAVEKNIKKYMAAKVITRAAGDMVGGYVMAGTSGFAHTTADVAQRMQGDIQTDVDENGNTVYAGHTKGKNFGTALGEGLTNQAIENQSELVGEYFAPIGKVLGKWLGKGAGKVMGKVDRALVGTKAEPFYNTARKLVTTAVETKGLASLAKNMKELQKKAKWNGTLGEYLEEVVGNVENALFVGDMDFSTKKGKGVFNASDNLDTGLGVGLMGGAFAGIKSVAWGVYKARGGAKGVARRTMNDIDKKLQGNEKWAIIKKSIDLAKDDGLALNDILTDVMTSKMSKDEKKLVWKYAFNQQVLRGAEMATYKPRTASVKRTEKDGKFGVEWYDKNGNAIDSRSFDSKERADAYEQELLDERDHDDMRNMYDTATGLNMQEAVSVVNPEDADWRNKAAEKAKEKEDKAKAAIAKFEQDNGLEKGAVGKMLDKDAWELTDEESAYVPALKSLLKDLAYPTNVVNEEHFEEEGAEMADTAGFENDTPNVEVTQAARQEYEAAKAAYEDALNKNEILKDEVTSRLNKGMQPADILVDLEGFSDEEMDTVARFFNADAKFNGFMNQTQKNIQNAVEEKVDEHTFRGTINGVPDTKNRVEISNGEETFTLIGGELTTDDDGNVVDRGKTNLVVVRNSDGDLVLLPSTDKLTILPNSQTLEDFGNQLFQELGANATEAIDPNNDLVQSQAEAATEQVQPAVEATNSEEVKPSEEAAQVETPTEVTPEQAIEEVVEEEKSQDEAKAPVIPVDDNGVKQYHDGVSVDDAIDDILKNKKHNDPNKKADTYIREAQSEIDKIDKKYKNKELSTIEEVDDENLDEEGYEPKTAWGKDMQNRQRLQNKIDYYNALKERWAERNGEETVNNADVDNNEAEKGVSSQVEDRIKAAKEKYGDSFDDDFSHANDVKELVSMFLGKGRNLAWTDVNGKRGLQKELGWTRKVGGDTKAIETFLAKNGEGMGIDDFVHMIWESGENGGRFDTQEIKNALLGLIQSAQSKSDITDYMYNSRVGAAEKAHEAEQRAQENGAIDEETPINGELADDELPFPMPNDEELDYIFDDKKDDTRQGNESVDGTDMPEHQGEVENNAESGAETQGEQLDVSDSEGQDREDGYSESGEVQNVDASSAGSSVATGTQQDRGTSAVQGGVSTTHKGEDNGEKPTTRETKEGKGEVKEISVKEKDYSFLENNEPVEYKGDGKRHSIISIVRSGEQVSANQFSKPRIERVYITGENGKMIDAKPEDLTPFKGKTVNDNKKENNKAENDVSLQQKELTSEAKSFAENRVKEDSFIDDVRNKLVDAAASGEKLTIVQLRKLAEAHGLEADDKKIQELVELAIVSNAREVMSNDKLSNKEKFDSIVSQYYAQPTISQRDTDRINLQQFSTPTPMAALMDIFLNDSKEVNSVLEPTAGNGALVIGFPVGNVHVNEIDKDRRANLLRQGFRRVTNQLGQVPFEGEKVDVVVSNPPFGSLEQRLPDGTKTEAKPMVVDGYEFTALDHVIAVNALASMKDNGRAAIIVGGNTEYKDNGSIQGKKDKSFLGYLYNHYNVVDVINIDGALYGKQGTTYPVRMILIDGRRTDTTEKKYAPTKSNARAEQVTSFDELYNRVDYDIQNFTENGSRLSVERSSDTGNLDNSIQGADNLRESSKNSGVDAGERDRHGDGKRTARKPKTSGRVRALSFDFGDSGEQADSRETTQGDTERNLAGREAARDDRQDSNTEGGKRGVGGIDTKSVDNEHTTEPKDNRPNGGREKRELVKVELGQDKAPYVAQSEGTSLGTVMPATMIAPVQRALSRINGGDVDSFVQEKLGYSSREELYEHLGAEQIDGVAMAIHQMEGGNGFIIGDGTGVGKGRQAASILRYAIRQGKTPIFVTQKAGLFTDMYRDMVDIGAADLFHPLIINSTDDEVDIKEGAPAAAKYFKGNAKRVTVDGVEYRKITDKETGEEEIFKIVSKGLKNDKGKSIQELIDGLKETGKLPNGYTFVMVTYSQLTSGTQEYVNGEAKAKRKKGNKAYTSGEIIGDKKRELLKLIAKDNFVVLDESHTAAGNSAGYFMDMTKEAKGVTFLSGTFAKNPDCMPLYAMKTAISKAGLKVSDLIEAVRNGGNTLQEIMSRALSESGQMVHRERPLDGVVNNWVQDEDKEKIEKDRKRFDAITEIFNMAIAFQENYVDPAIERLRQTASLMQGDVEKTSGTDKMGIDNEPFVSGTYQLVRQLLFAVKAEQIADTAIKSIKEGRKPVIAISNTMGRFTEDLPLGEDVTMPDFSETIGAKIGNLLKYTRIDDQGNKIPYSFNLKDLGEGAEEAYKALEDKISQSSSGLGISPIDTIKNKIRKAGYSVGELTGRKEEIIFNEDGSVRKVTRRDSNKKVQTNKFNNGELDVVILNKSASTGISLHSNVKFGDTRQREMIIGQLEEDVNDAIQMLGRVNRTGQVSAPVYTYLISNVPAEQRLMMMYKTKVKSLFANTSGNQDAKDAQVEVPDMLNKYGTQVVWNYLIEHRDIYNMLADPLGWGSQEAVLEASEDDLRKNMPNNEIGGETIRKVTGRMALLPSNLQEQVLNAINEEYQTMINILDEAGENDLKMNELPLNATTKSKGVWIKGNEPNGENIFADNTNVETVEMDVLKKPMTEEEISKSIDRMQEGKDWETWRDEKKAELDAYEEKELKEIDEKNEARAKLAGEREYLKVHDSIKNILSRIEKKRKEGKDLTDKEKAYENFTEKDIEEAANNAKQSKYDEVRSRLNTLQANVRAKVRGFKDKLDKFTPGKIIIVPSDLRDNAETSFTMERGTLIGFKFNKDWTPSSSTAIFATTDGRRKVEIPLSKSHALSLIQQASFAFAGQLQAMKLSDWGKMATTKSRKQGHIITGNILAGIDKINKMGLFGARLVRYTTSEGEIVDGILMPDNFNVNSLKGGAAISTKLNDILNGKKVTSIDKKVEVGKKYSWESISLRVPKSKAEGGQYWNDEELLGLVDGKFHTHAGMMEAVVPNENLEKVLNLLSTKFGVQVPVDVDLNDSKVRYSDDNDNVARAKNAERVQKAVSDTVKALGGGKHVVQVRSIDDVPDDIRQHIEERHAKGKKVTGWYRNGKVYLFMPDITNGHEAVVTILHELVGHKGMLEVFGKVGYQNVMRALWMNGPKEMRTWVNEHVAERGWDFYEAMDEYLAHEAEKGGKLGFWQNIRRVLTEALNKLGIPVDLNIYDTKYLLWLAKNQIKEGEPMSAARRNAVLRKIKAQNVSAITYNGRVYDNSNLSQEERDIFSEDESIGENDTPTAMNAKAFYHSMLKRASFVWNEAYADYMASLKILQKALGGENIPDSQNAYMAENAMSSQNQQEGEKYIKECVKPLEEIINKCIGLMGWKLADLERYVYVKHGLERNRVFAFRDWYNNEIKRVVSDVTELNDREQEIYTKKVDAITTDFEDGKINEEQRDKKIEKAIKAAHKEYLDEVLSEWKDMRKQAKEKLDNGSSTLADYYGEMDNFLSQYVKDDWDAGKNDMSGLSSMYGDEEGNIDDAELISRVMDIEGSLTDENVAELWKCINAATRFAIDKEYESGLMTEDSYDRVNGMFDFYVPLRLFAEDTAEDVYQYMTGKGNVSQFVGKTLKHAKGRKSEAKHPIATIFAMATKAISNGNRNLMKQRFARLVRATYDANDNDRLVTEQEVYLENIAADGEPDNWVVAYPSLLDENGEPLTDPDEIMNALDEFNEHIAQKRKEGKIKKVTDSGDIPYKVLSDKDKMEHIVEVRIAGRPHLFVINGDPRAAQAINGQLNPSAGAYKLFSALNGMMSAAFTSYSITFAMRNMTRDFEFFGAALNTKEGSEYAKAATKYYAELTAHKGIAEKKKDLIMPTIHVLFRKYKEGTLNMDNELERDFKDFVDNGGVTGYTQMKNVDDWHKGLEKIVKRLGAKGAKKAVYATGDVISAIGGFVDGVNEGIENMARFATYRASRHKAGRSILRSVSDAKDVTVNFNRKGAGAKTAKYAHSMNAKVAGHSAQFFRGTKLFFNATMQAIMNFFNMAKKHPVKAIRNLASVPFAIGIAAPLINSMLFSLFGGDGDDPYADLPEFERRSNWCIYVGNNSFIKIPISQEMKPFLGLGDLLAGYIYNPNLQSLDKNALEQITELMALYSPIDVNTSRYGEDGITGAFMNLLIPQSFSPVVEVATNTSWTNRPIQKENEYNQNAPEYKKAYRNTNSSVVELSRKWHELFGGDEAKRADLAIGEISPAYAQYLVQQYSGGVGSFIMSSGENINSFAKLLRGEDVDFNIRTVEGAKAFLTQGDDRTIMNRTRTKYYKYLDDAKKTDYVASVYRQEMKGGNALSAAKLHALQRSNEFKSAKLVERYSRYLKKLDQAKDAAKRDSEKKMLQKLYNDKLQECVSKLDSLKNGGSN